MTDRLLPCPFCRNGDGLSVSAGELNGWKAQVYCSNCDALGGWDGYFSDREEAEQDAVRIWNTRTPSPSLGDGVVEKASALVSKLDECDPHITDAFMHRHLRCGEYAGPNYGEELKVLRRALSAAPKPVDHPRIPGEVDRCGWVEEPDMEGRN